MRVVWQGAPATLTFLDDISERRRAEEDVRIELSLQRLRNEVLQMQDQKDWELVVRVFHEELRLWIPFNACGINFVDVEARVLTAYSFGPRRGVHQNVHEDLHPAVLEGLKEALERERPFYRYRRCDPRFATTLPPEVNSVLDVPFIGGTVAVNSTEEEAFSERDIAILQRFAQVISQGYRRLKDLRALMETEERFRQAQKLEVVGQLAGGVAHDFNNLLTVINGYAQFLLKKLDADTSEYADLQEIQKAGERGNALVQQLLAFSRRQVMRSEVLHLNAVLTDCEKMLHRLLGEDIALELNLDPSICPVLADAGQIQQILMNLAVNARDAMMDGGRLLIEITEVEWTEEETRSRPGIDPGSYVRISVSDTGSGMDEATRDQIFEPFFTTKELGRGTGLGLATVYGIVKQSGGDIQVYSEVGQGTTFRIYLPCADRKVVSQTAVEEPRNRAPKGTETVLVAEDDAGVRRVVCTSPRAQGYAVLEAGNGREAADLAERHKGNIHLLLTDVVMPEMNGRELVDRLVGRYPELKVLFMSGYAEGIIDRHGVLDEGFAFLEKPFDLDTLLWKVHEVLNLS